MDTAALPSPRWPAPPLPTTGSLSVTGSADGRAAPEPASRALELASHHRAVLHHAHGSPSGSESGSEAVSVSDSDSVAAVLDILDAGLLHARQAAARTSTAAALAPRSAPTSGAESGSGSGSVAASPQPTSPTGRASVPRATRFAPSTLPPPPLPWPRTVSLPRLGQPAVSSAAEAESGADSVDTDRDAFVATGYRWMNACARSTGDVVHALRAVYGNDGVVDVLAYRISPGFLSDMKKIANLRRSLFSLFTTDKYAEYWYTARPKSGGRLSWWQLMVLVGIFLVKLETECGHKTTNVMHCRYHGNNIG